MVSRLSGFVRSILLAAALGNLIHADVFTVANTRAEHALHPAGRRHLQRRAGPAAGARDAHDPDRGEAYTNRVVTLAALFLGASPSLLVVGRAVADAAVLVDPGWPTGRRRESASTFARYCLPQVFFYGMYVLVGQILNARGRFGPMMWAPIANNVISVAVLVTYLVTFGRPTTPRSSAASRRARSCCWASARRSASPCSC